MEMESQSERKCLVKVSTEETSSQKSISKRKRSQDSADDNMDNFRNDFPEMTELVWIDFLRAASKNQLLDQLDGCRKEHEIISMDSRKKLVEMIEKLKNEHPNLKPQNSNIYVAGHADSAITDDEQLAAYFANRSPKEVAKDYKLLPRFRITRCEEIHSRAELPPAHRASIEGARRFPDHLGLISYDTAGVIHKIRNPQSRRDNDSFCATLDDIWIYNETRKKYEPHSNQQIFHNAFQLEYYRMQRRKIIYVEISEEDLPNKSRSTQT
ncbi:predicted protein [Sclerotinia sclerotiorum 1980 UF-70]|uniref:Uncharacterized protein n=1 Tax=Sclerotinia sclerotiorum (strain ATCC 18683 / 1980 / Ss-1) TaxID=665079 RepID=A7F8S9_SCLS1|nr:predicted protein [Sclerotinia sclerotiorum 1980 UF-70]EDN99150.1 predicted protein [Sclerotinia sclerotiorum 1980 UF-70]